MRTWFLFASLAVFGTALLAQVPPAGPTPGLSVVTVVHEPTASDVGPYIAGLQIPNPQYNPEAGTTPPVDEHGQPRYNTAYGSGGGISDELDSISPEFYALGGTTTHDLAIVLNNTGASITMNSSTLAIAACRPAQDYSAAPEQSSPDGSAVSLRYAYDLVSVTIPDGSSVAMFLIVTKWKQSLDTSPRDYIWTFTFNDTGGNPFVLEAPLTVPKVGGSDPSGCVSGENGFPSGVWLVVTGGLVGLVVRRKLLEKARA